MWDQLKKLIRPIKTSNMRRVLYSKVWTIFLFFAKKYLTKDFLTLFDWMVTVYICFFGKFFSTLKLKNLAEETFSFEFNLEEFNSKLKLIKNEFKEMGLVSNGIPQRQVDITSEQAYGTSYFNSII